MKALRGEPRHPLAPSALVNVTSVRTPEHRPEHRSCAVGQCLSVADYVTVTGRQDVRMSFMLASSK